MLYIIDKSCFKHDLYFFAKKTVFLVDLLLYYSIKKTLQHFGGLMIEFIIIIAVIILDQLSKYWVLTNLKGHGSLPLIEGVFHFTYAENSGVAFSFLSGKQSFVIVITSMVMFFMLFYLYRFSKAEGMFLQNMALAFIIGGGIANLIDRVRFGFVVDFLDFRLINFAIFNVADSFIVVGGIIFALNALYFARS